VALAFEPNPEYLTIEQAAAYLEVTPAAIRRLLRQHGVGDFLRASISKQVLIRREDLDTIDLAHGGLRTVAGKASGSSAGANRRTGAA
jgi:excisionase family DNA binding protein